MTENHDRMSRALEPRQKGQRFYLNIENEAPNNGVKSCKLVWYLVLNLVRVSDKISFKI
jgi:hypothetical protein